MDKMDKMDKTQIIISSLYVNRLGHEEVTGIRGIIPMEYIHKINIQLCCKLSQEGYEDLISFKPLSNGDLEFNIPYSVLK